MNKKSSVAAGLLGLFLGGIGAHNWYLGQKGKGITHVILCVASGILFGIAYSKVMSAATSMSGLMQFASGGYASMGISAVLGVLLVIVNGIWAFIESIIIFCKGDAGLPGNSAPAPAQSAPAKPAAEIAPDEHPETPSAE